MIVRNANSINWKPLDLAYMHDPDISFKGDFEYFDEGFNFITNDALTHTQDVAVNKYTNFYLTGPEKLTDVLDLKTKKDQYPKYIHSPLSFQKIKSGEADGTYHLYSSDTRDVVGNTFVSTTSATSNNIFEIELLDSTYARVRQFNGRLVKYLTHYRDVRADYYFELERTGYTSRCDPQQFTYIFDEVENSILLTQNVQMYDLSGQPTGTSACYIAPVFADDINPADIPRPDLNDTATISAYDLRLSAYPISDSLSVLSEKYWRLRPHNHAPEQIKLQTNWVSYKTGVDSNNLEINKSKTHPDIKNNLLLQSYTDTLSSSWPQYIPDILTCAEDTYGKLNVDITPLKNQHTAEGNTSRSNIFDNEDLVNHRVYHGLHTGTNQEHGYDSIYMSYATGTKELNLPAGKVTYFHFPPVTEPYTQLNINDTSLIDEGSVASDSPVTADKVFKKRAFDNELEQFTDEVNGTFLCSWLSGSENPTTRPVWVDRYYDPNYYNQHEAYKVINTGNYLSSYDKITQAKRQGPFFDVLSNLLFEKNTLYAYHHIGFVDNINAVNSLSGSLIVKDAETYRDLNNIELFNTSANNWICYDFDTDKYARTSIPNCTGSFTVTFQLTVDDWQKPFAHSVVGNYSNDGFAIYNEENVTPFLVIPYGPTITIYNTNFEVVKEFNLKDTSGYDKNVRFLVKKDSTNSFWILAEDNVIHEFDLEGIERSRIKNHILTSTGIIPADFNVDDENNLYILQSPGVSGNYIKFTPSLSGNAGAGYDFECINTPLADSPISITNECNEYGEFRAVLDQFGIAQSYEHSNFTTNIDELILQDLTASLHIDNDNIRVAIHDLRLSQGSTIDNLGNTWFVLKDKLYYTPDPSTVPGTVVATPLGSSEATATINAINCDKHGHIWVLYQIGTNHKLAELKFRDDKDTATRVLQTIDLGNDIDTSVNYIEFIYEFTAAGYEEHVYVFTKESSGDNVIKINSNTGKVISKTDLGTKSPQLHLTKITPTSNGVNLHDRFTLSAYDTWVHAENKIVEEQNARQLAITFTTTGDEDLVIDFIGENRVTGFLDNEYMGVFENPTPGERVEEPAEPIKFFKHKLAGVHILKFIVENTTGAPSYVNPLSIAFTIKKGDTVLLTSTSLNANNIISLGSNPEAKYYGLNLGTKAWKDMTGNTYHRANIRPRNSEGTITSTDRYLRAKLKAKNLYAGFLTKAQNDTFYLDWKIPPTLKPGSHYITTTYDAEAGVAKLYVDSILQDAKTLGIARYHFNEIMTKPLYIGSTSFYDNEPLFHRLRQPGHYMSIGMSVCDFKIYNKPLNYYEIFSHTARLLKVEDVMWNIPTGQRTFIDTVERMFKFKTPDRKSTSFNLQINNAYISDPSMKAEVERAIKDYISYVSPLHTSINSIAWTDDELGLGESSLMSTLTSTISFEGRTY